MATPNPETTAAMALKAEHYATAFAMAASMARHTNPELADRLTRRSALEHDLAVGLRSTPSYTLVQNGLGPNDMGSEGLWLAR
jgi:hypothetical protein